jgi:hypothetical protein
MCWMGTTRTQHEVNTLIPRGLNMFLYEIKAASFAHQLNELASADIDGDLEKAAGEISKATGAGQDDETAGMGGDDFGAAPNPEAGASPMQMGDEGDELATDDPLASTETDEEEDEMLMQKVDSVLVSAAKGHPYTRNYSHDDKSKIHPYKILSMQMDELQSLRTMARNKANIESFNGDIGSMDNPEIKFFQDLVSYVDKLIEVKKSATKEYTDGKQGKNAKKPEQRPESKTKAGAVKPPKVQ